MVTLIPALLCCHALFYIPHCTERERAGVEEAVGRRELGKEEGGLESNRTEKEIKKDKERRRETCLF